LFWYIFVSFYRNPFDCSSPGSTFADLESVSRGSSSMALHSSILTRSMNIDPAVMQQTSTPENLDILYTGPRMAQFLRDNKIEGGQQSLTVLGHRGSGKNRVCSAGDAPNARHSIMENTIKSLALAAENGVDFVEFDVQVTKDGHAVIFHDDYIIIDDKGLHNARRIGQLGFSRLSLPLNRSNFCDDLFVSGITQ